MVETNEPPVLSFFLQKELRSRFSNSTRAYKWSVNLLEFKAA